MKLQLALLFFGSMLLAGCGGTSSSPVPPPPPETPIAAMDFESGEAGGAATATADEVTASEEPGDGAANTEASTPEGDQ